MGCAVPQARALCVYMSVHKYILSLEKGEKVSVSVSGDSVFN